MGWASGSELLDDIWKALIKYIPEGISTVNAGKELIEIFENYDCDTTYETEVYQYLLEKGAIIDEN